MTHPAVTNGSYDVEQIRKDFPALAMQVYGNTLMMLWPASAPALKLETTTNLASPSWTPMPAPLLIGDQFVVPASMTDQSRFYRLHYSP